MHRVYTQLLNPREHPDDLRRHVRPPSWEAFGHRTRFTALRGGHDKSQAIFSSLGGLAMEANRVLDVAADLEKCTVTHGLGDVVWPAYPILYAENLEEVVAEIKRRGLFLFDIWGYVPGSGTGGFWQQYKPPAGALELFERELGERWLGMDVGEQDGRYMGYAPQMTPASAGRFEQYLNFQRHFQRMCDDLGNKMSTLVSLNFGHYLLKEGVYNLIGAETAQALPNGQVYYAFIRGAGKQYGVPWFGNASVWNRWGFKNYGSEGTAEYVLYGPTKGTSLGLLKRLLYSHLLYNCVLAGFEGGWFDGDQLSPVGHIQRAANRWVQDHGSPGTLMTPVGLLLDFFSGWSFPRHLYSENVYRAWGNLPYEAGDHLTDGTLDLLYPGYQDASYFHDESGFLAPTPYGDIADCLLSDAPGWALNRYPLLVVAGALKGGAEIRDKLQAYVEQGGRLFVTAGSLAALPGGLAGIEAAASSVSFAAGQRVHVGDRAEVESVPFELRALSIPGGARTLARCGDAPAVVEVACGAGSLTVFASPFGVGAEAAVAGPIKCEIDRPLAKPFPLLNHVRAALDRAFRGVMLFDAGSGLSLITCRKDAGEYTLGVCNNALEPRALELVSHCGPIESVRELAVDESEKAAAGYLPDGCENAAIGVTAPGTIAGGDIRIFSVRVREQSVREIPHVVPPRSPRGRVLHLRNVVSIQEAILARPTFFEHFDGVAVDWKYFHHRETDTLEAERGWLARQGVRVYGDLSSGINLYPTLRLVENHEADYQASLRAIERTLEKLAAVGGRDLIFTLHRPPENQFTWEQTQAAFEVTLKRLGDAAATRGVTLHLRTSPNKPPRNVTQASQWAEKIPGVPGLRVALSTALLLAQDAAPEEVARLLPNGPGLWLLSAPRLDLGGHLWDAHAPIAGTEYGGRLKTYLAIAPDAPIVFDAVYPDADEEYRDAAWLAGRMTAGSRTESALKPG